MFSETDFIENSNPLILNNLLRYQTGAVLNYLARNTGVNYSDSLFRRLGIIDKIITKYPELEKKEFFIRYGKIMHNRYVPVLIDKMQNTPAHFSLLSNS